MSIISIIIPVYNAALYLNECLNSVLNQSFVDIEVICVNDGSTDNSLEIINDFGRKDTRIRLVNQQNQGVSAARNVGIAIAQGEYIGFVDADDYVSVDYFEQFIKHSGSDMAGIKPSDFDMKQLDTVNKTQLYQHMLASDSFNSVCFKIFKRDLVVKNKVFFTVGMRLGEDAHFILNFLQYATTVALFSDNQGYFYRENVESATKAAVRDNSVFDRVFSEFKLDHQKQFHIQLTSDEILNAKLQKFWNSYLAALSLYLRANTAIEKAERYLFIKKSMLEFNTIYKQTDHHQFWKMTRSRFEQFVLSALIQQQFWKLKIAYCYSHFRNGIK